MYCNTGQGVSDSTMGTSFPLPLTTEEVGGGSAGGGVEGVEILCVEDPLANCHAGIDGFPGRIGVEGPVDKPGPRLRRRAFNDLSSCCSSARDWLWLSLFFSIIYRNVSVKIDLHMKRQQSTLGSISRTLLTSSRISRISSLVFASPSRISLTTPSTS